MNGRALSILMVTHHRKMKMHARPFPMCEYLAKRGHKVVLLVTADTNRFRIHTELINGVTVVEIPDLLWGRYRSGWDLWNGLRKFWYLVHQEQKFDLIHIHETRPATILPILAFLRRHKVPLVIDWNDWWAGKEGVIAEIRPWWQRWMLGWVEAFFEERFRTFADGTTVISTALRERAVKLGVPSDSILHLPGGAKADKYPYMSKEQCRAEIGIPIEGHLLGFASLDSHLDMDLIFDALRRIITKLPSCKLIVTGQAKKNARQKAKEYAVDEHVIWTGFVPFDTFMTYLGCCDLFLLPLADKMYNRGRWPNKLMDYITVGRPVVTNPVGDVKEVLRQYDIGLLVGWDPDEFADAVIYLLSHPRRAEQMGENARRLAEEEMAWSRLVGELEAFYKRVLENYRARRRGR